MMQKLFTHLGKNVHRWLVRHKKQLLIFGGSVVVAFVIAQLVYPWSRLPLFTSIDGINVSYMKRADATKLLDQKISDQPINLKLSNTETSYGAVKPAEIGLTIDYSSRIDAYKYSLPLRLVPTSLLWAHLIPHELSPNYSSDRSAASTYLTTKFGPNCTVPAQNATLVYKNQNLTVKKSQNGGTCQIDQAATALLASRPLVADVPTITIPAETIIPAIKDSDAQALLEMIESHAKDGVSIAAGDKRLTIPRQDVVSWLSFSTEGDQLKFEILADRSQDFFIKKIQPLVEKPVGVPTVITTKDFAEISRVPGQNGQTLNAAQTRANLYNVLIGESKEARAATQAVPAKVVNNRSYTKTNDGIKALIAQYAEDNPGSFGISFQEIAGGGTGAGYQADKQFVTASTYKLFVAYGTLQKVEKREWQWSDGNIAGGRNLETCFTDMIVKSDNPCAESLLQKLGFTALTKNLNSIGLSNTTFLKGDSPLTTAGDLSLFLQKLHNGDLDISKAGRDRLLGLMSRQVYRQGVPAGSKGSVADKVGFLGGLLHDASIVTLPGTTYVLVVMTDGSSWGKIAELTRQLEALL